jgi:hypothetical protein
VVDSVIDGIQQEMRASGVDLGGAAEVVERIPEEWSEDEHLEEVAITAAEQLGVSPEAGEDVERP